MGTLREKIIEKIKSEGQISFETFMELTLYHSEYGYYTKGSAMIGRSGDFYTASHLHPVFGAVIGRQMEEMWELMGMPDNFQIVEMGAGMGYLAKDMLEYLKGVKGSRVQGFKGKGQRPAPYGAGQGTRREKNILRHLKYTIIEMNPHMKTKQQELLKDFPDKICWVSDLNELEHVTGCFLSNELLDAFPVRILEMDDELMEIYVTLSHENFSQKNFRESHAEQDYNFIEVKMPCSTEVREYFKKFSIELPRGFRTEVNLRIRDWLKDINDKLEEGFILTIDYGYPAQEYYSEERNKGTLLCYHRHQVNEDPYQNIGEQDITAHVNFSSLKKWGEEMGLKTIGFCPQGTFFVSLGIDEVITELYGNTQNSNTKNPPSPPAGEGWGEGGFSKKNYSFEIAKIKRLLLPEGMGESHKVMVQYKGEGLPILKGFSLRNQIRYL